jgi:hypothetical protein
VQFVLKWRDPCFVHVEAETEKGLLVLKRRHSLERLEYQTAVSGVK